MTLLIFTFYRLKQSLKFCVTIVDRRFWLRNASEKMRVVSNTRTMKFWVGRLKSSVPSNCRRAGSCFWPHPRLAQNPTIDNFFRLCTTRFHTFFYFFSICTCRLNLFRYTAPPKSRRDQRREQSRHLALKSPQSLPPLSIF